MDISMAQVTWHPSTRHWDFMQLLNTSCVNQVLLLSSIVDPLVCLGNEGLQLMDRGWRFLHTCEVN